MMSHIIDGLMARAILAKAKEDLKRMNLLPRVHITVDLSREKVRTQRTQEMVVPYAQPCLSPKRLASLSTHTSVVENTRGVNEASSTFQTLSLYSHFSSFHGICAQHRY